MGGSCQACERFWAIHRDGVSKNQPVERTWSLRRSRGSKTHYYRKNNRGGRFPFSTAGKRIRHGHKATVNRGHFHGGRL